MSSPTLHDQRDRRARVHTVIVGAGPVGLFCGMALARKGHQVVVIDRDPPPLPSGEWERRGVMQFKLPHFFRQIVRETLLDHLPDVWDALVAYGCLPAIPDGAPESMTGLQARRATFERAFWSRAAREPALTLGTGRAEALVVRGDRIGGVLVDGAGIEADLVIVASGRSGRLGNEYRAAGEGGSCGFSYAARMYRARCGVDPPTSALPMVARHEGYVTAVFPQDDRTLSVLIARPTHATNLAPLRYNECFGAATGHVPNLAPWTDQQRFEPITDVMAGNGLFNTYRGQLDGSGRAAVAGVFFVGDTVCTTNPSLGRGVSLGFRQAGELVRLLSGTDLDYRGIAQHFDDWCREHIRPWYEDHVYCDAASLARFAGQGINIEAPLPSDVICAAAEQDQSILPVVGPFMAMLLPPTALRAVEEKARALLRTGWRPTCAAGPTGEELGELLARPAAAPGVLSL